jgi:hypothetical protein
MELGGERMLLRCGTEERKVSPSELVRAVEEMGRTSHGQMIEVRRFGLVRTG